MLKNVAASVAGLWLVAIPLFGLIAAFSSVFVAVLAVTLLLALPGGVVIGYQGYSLGLHRLVSLLVSMVSMPLGVFMIAILADLLVPECKVLNCPDDRVLYGLATLIFVTAIACGLQTFAQLIVRFARKLLSR